MKRRVHTMTLLLGLACVSVAVGATMIAYQVPIHWGIVAIAAPLTLVGVGVVGMATNRSRS